MQKKSVVYVEALSEPVEASDAQVQAGELQGTGAALTADLCQQCWDCSGVCQSAVRTISARVDTLGRMTGTFEYSRKGVTGNKDEHFRQTMIVEMVSVTRRW